MYSTLALGKLKAGSKFSTIEIKRNTAREEEITFEIKFCGICHTDVHVSNNELQNAKYPCVPGHEIAGIVMDLGSKVTKFKKGDRVGVGYFMDSCLNCEGLLFCLMGLG